MEDLSIIKIVLIILAFPFAVLVISSIVLLIWLLIQNDNAIMENKLRFIKAYGYSLLGAILAGSISVYVFTLILPPTDGAYGLGLKIFADPFVLNGMLMFAIPLGVFLSPLYFRSTLNKHLFRCSIFVYATTSIASGIFSLATPLGGLIGSLITVIWALTYCKKTASKYFVSPNVA